MEKSTAYLTYKGSISEAIVEAQKQKKLFLIYISGEDENSINLENSTWLDVRVASAVSRYCIFLQLIQGHVEASQFSAIYPQKSVPSISAVGYNGVMLWQHEGYIDGESFVENIEKAWASMHLQDTAAVLLSAALASKKPEPSNSSSADAAPAEQEEPSNLHDPSSLAYNQALNVHAEQSNDAVALHEQQDTATALLSDALDSNQPEPSNCSSAGVAPVEQGESSNLHDPSYLVNNQALNVHAEQSDDVVTLVEQQAEDISKENKTSKLDTANAAMVDTEDSENKENETAEIMHSASQNRLNFQAVPWENPSDETHPKSSPEPVVAIHLSSSGSSQLNADDAHAGTRSVPNEIIDREHAMKSTAVHLSIRMPSGTSLQEKFAVTDTLRSVKNYVDDNHGSNLGSYDLAIPYPRRIFGEEDMGKALSELGFAGRQALIVIPKNEASVYQRGPLSSNHIQAATNQTTSSDNAIGYFGYLKRALSYLNPFSYLGGNGGPSSSQQAPNDDLWQYRPNPALQNSSDSSNLHSTNGRASSSRSRTSSRPFGSNIHTLRHDEDDSSAPDRNTFWNGNSTQYGGNDKQ